MIKPKTNREAYALVLRKLKAMESSESLDLPEEEARVLLAKKANPWRGAQSILARHLGVARQLVSPWEEIPLKYALEVSEITKLPIDWVVPELYSELEKIGVIYGKPQTLSDLVHTFTKDASPCPKKKKPRKSKS